MEFSLPPEIDDMRRRIRRFVDERLIPLEADRANYDEHENIAPHVLAEMRKAAKAEGLWALQMPKRLGGQELPRIGMAACYEEMNRSIFGPVVFNSAAPDDGNMMILDRVLPEAMKPRWLHPIEWRCAIRLRHDGTGWLRFGPQFDLYQGRTGWE
jgi:acyl-CoA dehydrogenase